MPVRLVAVVRAEAHKATARNAQNRQDKSFDNAQILAFDHHRNENGDIECVQRDYRHFVRLPAPERGDFARRIHKEKLPLDKPYEAQQQPEYRRRLRHIRLLAEFAEHAGFRTDVTHGYRVKSATAPDHKSVHRTKARNDDEYHNNRAESGAFEQRGECVLRKRSADKTCIDFQHILSGQRARQPQEIQQIHGDYDNRADDKRDGQVSFGVFEFAVYRRCDNPALVCERERRDAREKSAVANKTFRHNVRLERLDSLAVDKSRDKADHAHKYKRNKFNERRGHLEFASKFRRQRVDRKSRHEERPRKRDLCARACRYVEQRTSVRRRNPSKYARNRR